MDDEFDDSYDNLLLQEIENFDNVVAPASHIPQVRLNTNLNNPKQLSIYESFGISGPFAATKVQAPKNVKTTQKTSILKPVFASVKPSVVYEPEIAHNINLEAYRTWIYPTNYPVRDYQFNIVQKALFSNTLVALPTGIL